MKRYAVIISILLTACMETACSDKTELNMNYEPSFNTASAEPIETPIYEPQDYTVDIEEYYFSEEEKNNAQKVVWAENFSSSFRDLKDLCTNEASIECKILTVANTINDGIPYTKYDVEVTDVLFGDLKVGDKVTVMQMGGYMTMQDEIDAFDNAVKFTENPEKSW